MCSLNSQNRKKQKWRHRMGPVNFGRVRMALRATKENNEEPSKSEMFIATHTKNGKQVDSEIEVVIAELQNRQNLGETADESFKAVFGNEQPGRVRCYGRSVTTTSLRKDEEITKIKQKHANEITSFKEEVKELKEESIELRKLQELKEEVQELQQLRHLMKVLVKNNPGLNLEDAEGCIGSNLPSPIDASSERATRGQNLPRSSGSIHGPILTKETYGDAAGNGGRKLI